MLTSVDVSLQFFTPSTQGAPQSERDWFRTFLESTVPVKSGTAKERRLAQTSVRAFMEDECIPAATAKGLPIRTAQTIVNWLKENNIKPCIFDRYRCEKCFLGRQAEARMKSGTAKEGDRATVETYLSHLKIANNQKQRAKEDKAEMRENVLTVVFDYSTFHKYTKEKVRI